MRLSACNTGMNLYETKNEYKAAIDKLNLTLTQNGFAVIPVWAIHLEFASGALRGGWEWFSENY
jgi:hypothetical protein